MNLSEKENTSLNEQNYNNVSDNFTEIRVQPEEKQTISGWLAIFLYLGLGGGSIVTIIDCIASTIGQGLNLLYTLLLLTPGILISITGISAIVAFHKRYPNAVSLAKTYIVMVVLDGIAGILISAISNEYESITESIRPFIWSGIWFTYLIVSKQVNAIIPPETRIWGKFEKVLLGGFIASCTFIIIAITYACKSDNTKNIFLTDETFITVSIEEANKELPKYVDEGIMLQAIGKEHKTVTYQYKMPTISRRDLDQHHLAEASLELKKEFLESLRTEPDDFIDTCFNEGYDIAIRYVDYADEYLFGATITKDDYLDYIK